MSLLPPAAPTPDAAAAAILKQTVFNANAALGQQLTQMVQTFWKGSAYTPAQIATLLSTDGGKYVTTGTAMFNYLNAQATLHGVPLATWLDVVAAGVPSGRTITVNGDQTLTIT